MLSALQRFLGGWRFAAASLAALLGTSSLLATMVILPEADSGLGAFAADFRVWCFAQDPVTGRMDRAQIATFLLEPIGLAGIVLAGWWAPLRGISLRRAAPWALAGLAATGLSGIAMAAISPPRPTEGELPFPAEGLRTEIPFPDLDLVDQDGAPVRAYPGKVLMITGVYGSCGYTCPMVFATARGAVEAVGGAAADLRVVAITLDPAHDTPAALPAWASAQGVASPLFHLASGAPPTVEATLDRLGFTRTRDAATGRIDHANLFLLVDRRGRLAYRFTLGERQARWLEAALRLLLAE